LILQNRYIELITTFGFNYKLVSGLSEERFNNAVGFILPI